MAASRRRCEVLLLSGWLLMRPPFVRDQRGRYDPYADEQPLPKWEQVAAFDREDACEQVRRAEREKADTALAAAAQAADGRTDRGDYDRALAAYYRALFARCLTAEHVHPPPTGGGVPGPSRRHD